MHACIYAATLRPTGDGEGRVSAGGSDSTFICASATQGNEDEEDSGFAAYSFLLSEKENAAEEVSERGVERVAHTRTHTYMHTCTHTFVHS